MPPQGYCQGVQCLLAPAPTQLQFNRSSTKGTATPMGGCCSPVSKGGRMHWCNWRSCLPRSCRLFCKPTLISTRSPSGFKFEILSPEGSTPITSSSCMPQHTIDKCKHSLTRDSTYLEALRSPLSGGAFAKSVTEYGQMLPTGAATTAACPCLLLHSAKQNCRYSPAG